MGSDCINSDFAHFRCIKSRSDARKRGGGEGDGREKRERAKEGTYIILLHCQRERAGTFDSILDIVARKKHSPGNRRCGGIRMAGWHTRAPLVPHMSKLGESGRSLRPMARRAFGVARSFRRGKSRVTLVTLVRYRETLSLP